MARTHGVSHPGTPTSPRRVGDPFRCLDPDHARRINTERKVRSHISQLAALGYRVTLEPAA
ncbi:MULTISPECIES: hypothetical protein [Rhodococcus]|uniref:hypothetical protein n=1 Tax=Rhodococcus TaxID=1827 RepID=UPI003662749C